MMDENDIDAESFLQLHHITAGYMISNMLVPG